MVHHFSGANVALGTAVAGFSVSGTLTAHPALANRRYLRLSTFALTALPAFTITLDVTPAPWVYFADRRFDCVRRVCSSSAASRARCADAMDCPHTPAVDIEPRTPPLISPSSLLLHPLAASTPSPLSLPCSPFTPSYESQLSPSRQHAPHANAPQRTFTHLVVARALPEEPIVHVGVVAEGAVWISRILAAPAPPTSAAADDSLGRKERERVRDKGIKKERRGRRPLRSNAKDKSAPPACRRWCPWRRHP
ncbi:hypothetical protein DFH09DRAFT_1357467 [Mycena vulgaris]|nr:hypothetical protein DFH09DRAFT_1357467 [Mycena vulgaris]